MSDCGRDRGSLGVGLGKSSQKWSAPRSAVRSIAWLGDGVHQLEDIRDNFFGKALCIWANKNDLIVFWRKKQ